MNPVRTSLRIGDEVLQEGTVDVSFFVTEIGANNRMGVRTHDHFVDLLIGHADAEAIHLMLAKLVFDELLIDGFPLLIDHLRRHAFAGLLLILLHLRVYGLDILLIWNRIAVNHNNILSAAGAHGIEGAGILKHPDNTESEHENPQDHACVLAHLGHRAHRGISTCLLWKNGIFHADHRPLEHEADRWKSVDAGRAANPCDCEARKRMNFWKVR